jgi:hypothetical protein
MMGDLITLDAMLLKNEKKCNQRRKIAALRDGIEGAGVTIYRTGATGDGPWSGGELLYASGELPGYGDDAIRLINARLAERGEKKVSQDDVYIHYMEAANNSFIQKYFMFLDATTLRNIASRGDQGLCFMNSHRTGGMSAPADLPYGMTFSGRYEEVEHEGSIHRRALLGVYMLKGHFPNGKLGPSTDSIHRAIDAGTLRDVSMGLNGGQAICDVCAKELGDKDCRHTPGTVKGLSEEHLESQKSRGVPGGKASYTVVDGQPYEVSAVFKGAVPGAGFRKAMSQKAEAGSDLVFSGEIVEAYGSMMDDSDLRYFKGKPKMKFSDFFKLASLAQNAGVELEDLDEGDLGGLKSGTQVPVSVASVKPSTQELDALEARKLELDARERDIDVMRFGVEADQFVMPLVSDGKVTGPDIDALKLCYVQAALDDKANPLGLSLGDKKVTRVEALKLANAGRQKHILTLPDQVTDTPVVPDGQKVLSAHDSPKDEDGPMSPERRKELHSYSVHGPAILNGK